MVVACCKRQMFWERPGSHAARSGLCCMFWHVLSLTCIVAAQKFRGCLKPHIPNIQNLKDGKSLCLSLSLSVRPVAGSSHHYFSTKATSNDAVQRETSGPGETQESQGAFITILALIQNVLASVESHNQSNSTHKLRIKASLHVLCVWIRTRLNK